MPVKHYTRQINKRKTDGKHAQWSDRQRLEAVTTYLLVGRWAVVSEATGIPIDTLKHWKQQDWWKETEGEVKRSRNIETSGKLQRVIDKTFKVLEDRVENGDITFNQRGELIRRPINARTSSEILSKALDKELLLQKLDDKPVMQEEAIMDRLKNIEATLINASKYKKAPQVIDVEPTAVPQLTSEERNDTRLQEGSIQDSSNGHGSLDSGSPT